MVIVNHSVSLLEVLMVFAAGNGHLTKHEEKYEHTQTSSYITHVLT
jgi:hypothetical protein